MSKCCWDICKFLLFIINFAALVSSIFRQFFTMYESFQFLRNRFYFRSVFERCFRLYVVSLALLFVVFYSSFIKLSGMYLDFVVIRFIIFRKSPLFTPLSKHLTYILILKISVISIMYIFLFKLTEKSVQKRDSENY